MNNEEHELSDIILEKDSGKIARTKKVLITIAFLILLFLIVLVVMKIINRPTQNSASDINLPPEPKNVIKKQKKEEQLFKQVPILEDKPSNNKEEESFENMVKSLKEKEINKLKENTQDTKEKIQKIVQKTPVSTKIDIKKEVKKVVNKVIPQEPKTVIKSNIPKKEFNKATKGVYIQVGATSRLKPDKKFLQKIKNSGFEYRLLPITINGRKITKILVGNFKNEKIARKNLNIVKKEINKNAFIYRVK